MRSVVVTGAILLGGALSSEASGGDADYPIGAIISEASEPGSTQITCSPLETADRPRIHCSFVQNLIELPKAGAEVEKEIAEAEALARNHPAEALKNLCGTSPPTQATVQEIESSPDGPERTFNQATVAACRAANFSRALQAYSDFKRQVVAHTCGLIQTTWEANFQRVDANTWVAILAAAGACHVSYVDTLWKEQGQPLLWNYRQVSTQPDAKKDTFCALSAGTHVYEYSWKNMRTRDLGCRYFRM
jgi:hypothetical protein